MRAEVWIGEWNVFYRDNILWRSAHAIPDIGFEASGVIVRCIDGKRFSMLVSYNLRTMGYAV